MSAHESAPTVFELPVNPFVNAGPMDKAPIEILTRWLSRVICSVEQRTSV
jgi:hypothetical protein